jgi:23S rRNA pseudouridine2605 synthase
MTRKKTTDKRVRLQKFLSEAGVSSRRRAEELIEAGRVLVNDVVVDRLPAFVNPGIDSVIVDGTPVRPQALDYFIVHKPKGVVCTNRDPAGRLRAVDLLPPTRAPLNVVGRLDAESTGLLLMTNDGELAEQITHPRLELPKVYRVEVRGQVPRDIIASMKKGVYLSEGKVSASDVEVVRRSRVSSVLKITLREGRNRQVRRMLARLDHPVKTLKRIEIGPLSLKRLPLGACRRLTPRELTELRRAIRSAKSKRRRTGAGAGRPETRKRAAPAAPKQRTGRRAEKPAATPPARGQPDSGQPARPRRRLVT